jgi:DNA end-binding protein Ku
MWKGAVTFGLVNVPVRLYSATEDHDVQLHQVHDADGGRIRFRRTCEVCGEVIAFEDIDRAYEDGGRTVILSPEDLESLPVSRSREIEVVEFVPSADIDPIRLDRSYYLEPDSTSPKAYVLLRRALEQTDRIAIVQFSLSQKTRLAALRVQGEVLVLQTLLWDDEVRQAHFPALDQEVTVSKQELAMSALLVDSLSEDFDPSKFTDDYQEQLRRLIDAKLTSGDDVDTASTFGDDASERQGGEVLDLMEALRRSVDQTGKKRTPKKTTATKPTATKPTATKTSTRKRTAAARPRPEKATRRRAKAS